MSNVEKRIHWNKALLAGTLMALLFAVVSTATIVAQESTEDKTKNSVEKAKPEIEGSANLGDVIKKFIEENRKVPFADAAATAQNELAESKIVEGNFGIIQGYLVYTFLGIDNEEQQKYKVIVDAADGQVLYKSDAIPIRKFSKFNTAAVSAELDLNEAAAIAQKKVENGVVQMGMLRVEDDKAVYVFFITDSEQDKKHSVKVDANSGEVLDVSEGKSMKSWGFHGKHRHGHGYGYKSYSDKGNESSENTTPTGEQA
jgi:uncharacterized membrane protein YkoI